MPSSFLLVSAVALGVANAYNPGWGHRSFKVSVTSAHTDCPPGATVSCTPPVHTPHTGWSIEDGDQRGEDLWASLWNAQKGRYTGQYDDWWHKWPSHSAWPSHGSSAETSVATSHTSSGVHVTTTAGTGGTLVTTTSGGQGVQTTVTSGSVAPTTSGGHATQTTVTSGSAGATTSGGHATQTTSTGSAFSTTSSGAQGTTATASTERVAPTTSSEHGTQTAVTSGSVAPTTSGSAATSTGSTSSTTTSGAPGTQTSVTGGTVAPTTSATPGTPTTTTVAGVSTATSGVSRSNTSTTSGSNFSTTTSRGFGNTTTTTTTTTIGSTFSTTASKGFGNITTTATGSIFSVTTSTGYRNTTATTTTGPVSLTSTKPLNASTTSFVVSANRTSSTTARATTTTSTSCPSYTPVRNATYDSCNTASDRSKWCSGKSLTTDYNNNDYFTGQTRRYRLEITNTTLEFDGTGPKLALAVNGQVPGPVIEANWGDMVEVTVVNKLTDNSTTIHWHGVRQVGTNDQDGVPGVTECAIAGDGGSRTYTWHASSYGTSWYHSHAVTQYGDGVRGPIVIHGPATADYDLDMGTVMIDDTFTIPVAEQAARIAHFGPGGTFNTLFNGKNKSPDGSAGESFQWGVKPCRKHLFRLINSSSQNMYIVGFDKHEMTVISADFIPIKPYKTSTLKIAIGQRYDVIVEMNQTPGKYFVRAVVQTACPSGGANSGLGLSNAIISYEGATNSSATPVSQTNITSADANICADEPLASLVPYLAKTAGDLSAFTASAANIAGGQVAQVTTADDGTVFSWFLNNNAANVNYTQPTLQTLGSHASNSLISNPVILNNANQWVYFIVLNQFFASHPLHVHGHDFSVLGTGIGNFSSADATTLNFVNPTRRDTVMLQGSAGPGQPAGWTVIGFETDNPGAWLMHCHIIWHVDGGMALQFIERPNDIDAGAYIDKPSFAQECSALQAYQSANPIAQHTSGQSGLRKRTSLEDVHTGRFHAGAMRHIQKHKRYGARHASY